MCELREGWICLESGSERLIPRRGGICPHSIARREMAADVVSICSFAGSSGPRTMSSTRCKLLPMSKIVHRIH